MRERFVCCCNTQSWTRVFGWLSTLGCGFCSICLAILIVMLLVGSIGRDDIKQIESASSLSVLIESGGFSKTTALSFFMGGLLFMYIIGLLMSVMLLVGSYEGKPILLSAWIWYTIGSGAVAIILETVSCIILNGEGLGKALGTSVFVFLHNGFFVWIVSNHLAAIKSSIQHSAPIPRMDPEK